MAQQARLRHSATLGSRWLKWGLAALTGLLAVGAARLSFGTASAQAAANSWTIAIYINADHNLDSSAITDLEEMMQVGSAAGFNIVVQLDRNDEEADSGVLRGRVVKGDVEVVQELPELNSDDPRTLQEFTDWAFKKYPARRYGVILWDHGGQWDGGFGGDEHQGQGGQDDRSSMQTGEILSALQTSLKKNNIPKLAFFSFDTCLMGGLELLGEYAPLADVYIANPELDYGDGWDYQQALNLLKTTPSLTPVEFARREVATWRKHHQQDADRYYGVHVAYDTSKYAALSQAFQTFSQEMQKAFTNKQLARVLWNARARTVEYNFDPQEADPGASTPYADLGLLADDVARNTTSSTLKSSAQQLRAALKASIIAISSGEERQDVGGLSVWYPTTRDETFPNADTLSAYDHLRMNTSKNWTGFLRNWLNAVKSDTTAPRVSEPKIVASDAGKVTLTYTVQGDDVDLIYGVISRAQPGGKYLIYGDQFYQVGKVGNLTFNWDYGAWFLGDGKKGTFISNSYVEPGDPTFFTLAEYTPPKGAALDVALIISNKGQVLSALDASGIAPRGLTLEPGGTLLPYLDRYDTQKDDYDLVPGDTRLTIPASGLKGLSVKRQPLPAGTYEMLVGATDYVGNEEFNTIALDMR